MPQDRQRSRFRRGRAGFSPRRPRPARRCPAPAFGWNGGALRHGPRTKGQPRDPARKAAGACASVRTRPCQKSSTLVAIVQTIFKMSLQTNDMTRITHVLRVPRPARSRKSSPEGAGPRRKGRAGSSLPGCHKASVRRRRKTRRATRAPESPARRPQRSAIPPAARTPKQSRRPHSPPARPSPRVWSRRGAPCFPPLPAGTPPEPAAFLLPDAAAKAARESGGRGARYPGKVDRHSARKFARFWASRPSSSVGDNRIGR